MKTIEELKAFCEGYLKAKMLEHNGNVEDIDDWVQWGGYDLNIFGSYWGTRLEGNTTALSVDAYLQGWEDVLPDPIHTFDIKGETK